jgi:hypothetical protein
MSLDPYLTQEKHAVRRPQSKRFTRGFLVVAPGLTIKDRLRVLQPNDPDSYYARRKLVQGDMLDDVNRAKIVIINYHAFKLRERIELSKDGRSLLQGWGELLREDKHCQYSVSPTGVVSFVLTNGSTFSNTSGEGELPSHHRV